MYQFLRQNYQNLRIGKTNSVEKVWVKKLKLILDRNIHGKPLGCKIDNTHIKVGNIHIGSFYEAQILFSHNYWINKFSEWLAEEIDGKHFAPNDKIVLVGYETYFEPVLYALRNTLSEKYVAVDYLIYEEDKYIQSNRLTERRIRYLHDVCGKQDIEKTHFVFICGIASTLSTFGKMVNYLNDQLAEVNPKYKNLIKDSINYTIVQVLPKNHPAGFQFEDGEKLTWQEGEQNIATRTVGNRSIEAKFLVSVYCEWHNPQECLWCFPEHKNKNADPSDERPIIAVSDTSLIPLQMLDSPAPQKTQIDSQKNKIDFFQKDRSGKFVFKQFLYYGHTVRDEHHFQYYIRTGHLFREILRNHKDAFRTICNEIKQNINDHHFGAKNKQVNVIVSPRHFSDEMFSQAINEYVFDNQAHMISLDVKKEFRKNFEIKYSNFAYFLEQVRSFRSSKQKVNLNFYFVDDQIITGGTFYRIKSFISSLLGNVTDENVKIFAGVIVLVNRLSQSSKYNYVKEPTNQFFSIIDIAVSSVRNYGDACPRCKLFADALEYQKKSTLDSTAFYWTQKQKQYRQRSLDYVRKHKDTSKEETTDGYFLRFYCENTLWQGIGSSKDSEKNSLRDCYLEEDYLNYYYRVISKTLKEQATEKDRFELFVAFIKTISRPFIYYKECAKKATLKFLIQVAEKLKSLQNSNLLTLKYGKYKIDINFRKINEAAKYQLLTVLLKALASIDSTYLLNVERIVEWYNIVVSWNKSLCEFAEEENQRMQWLLSDKTTCVVERFYSVVLNTYKRIICGIGGDAKCQKFQEDFQRFVSNAVYYRNNKIINRDRSGMELKPRDWYNMSLFRAMFLESINRPQKLKDFSKEFPKTLEKYRQIAQFLKQVADDNKIKNIKFYYFTRTYGEKASSSMSLLSQQVFEIDTFANVVDIASILEQDNMSTVIKKLNSLGYCQNGDKGGARNLGNKWLFKMSHYTVDDFERDEKQNVGKSGKNIFWNVHVCLFIELKDATEIDDLGKLKILRNILSYRYSLTQEIRRDIDSGAIEAAIKAAGAKKLLSSDKIFGHGQIKDIDTLYAISEKLLKEYTDQLLAYHIISLFMDRCIGFGGTRELLMEYFSTDTDYRDITKPFHSLITGNGGEKNYIESYLQFIQNSQNCNALYEKPFTVQVEYVPKGDADKIKNTLKANLPYFYVQPMQSKEDDSPYQIVLIGLLDVLIRNACKHGEVSEANPIRIAWTINEENGEEYLVITVINDLKKKIHAGPQEGMVFNNWGEFSATAQGRLEENKVSFTALFFEKYLKRINSDKQEWKLELGKMADNQYSAKIKLKIKNKGE